MNKIILLISLTFLSASCDRDKDKFTGNDVEFYLLESFETPEGSSKIIESSVKLNNSALIEYGEIISYNLHTYSFKVSEGVLERLEYRSAFALTIDKEIIYTGYFWSSISSMSVDWIVIDVLMSEFSGKNLLMVQMGYPGMIEGNIIPDRRNDERILTVLRRDNKLIE